MRKYIYRTRQEMAAAAASSTAQAIKHAIRAKGQANIILGTGASQIDMLEHLVASEGVDWLKVVMFHLDEYIGIGPDHPCSFRKYLKECFVDEVAPLRAAYFIKGDAEDPAQECKRVGVLIHAHPIDVACIGIGENGHLAFNDPPADFETQEPYIIVQPNERCRQQQLGEGWFESLDQIPTYAISMTIRQILKSKQLVTTVPDLRKAEPVKNALEGPVTPQCPASILQQHEHCDLFLDEPAASRLSGER
ncbi:MAG: glucosamine-6-phosphate deaminase [Planctomycetes bacterium RBG_13_62_9]|nr:MAG: glucosamine-6-phosphate deaminase [Planctomycetes bacterium RBG_13_62_9]